MGRQMQTYGAIHQYNWTKRITVWQVSIIMPYRVLEYTYINQESMVIQQPWSDHKIPRKKDLISVVRLLSPWFSIGQLCSLLPLSFGYYCNWKDHNLPSPEKVMSKWSVPGAASGILRCISFGFGTHNTVLLAGQGLFWAMPWYIHMLPRHVVS